MGVRRFEDLVAWQLAHELEQEVFSFTARAPCCHDLKYCNQVRDSCRSTCRNTAEGFGRYYPKEFARFLRIAAASLHETKNHLHEAQDRQWITDAEHRRLVRLCIRAIAANSHLLRYLAHAVAPEPLEPAADPEPSASSPRRDPDADS